MDLSFWEIFVIAASCIIFLKPEDIPEILKQVGKLFRKLKKTMDEFKSVIDLDEDKNIVLPKKKVLGLDGKYHDAYDVKEVFQTKVFEAETNPENDKPEHK